MRIRHPAADEGKKIVVVVGSGFAGLNAAKALSQSKEVAVFLIDQRNYHLFQPLLYQEQTLGKILELYNEYGFLDRPKRKR